MYFPGESKFIYIVFWCQAGPACIYFLKFPGWITSSPSTITYGLLAVCQTQQYRGLKVLQLKYILQLHNMLIILDIRTERTQRESCRGWEERGGWWWRCLFLFVLNDKYNYTELLSCHCWHKHSLSPHQLAEASFANLDWRYCEEVEGEICR